MQFINQNQEFWYRCNNTTRKSPIKIVTWKRGCDKGKTLFHKAWSTVFSFGLFFWMYNILKIKHSSLLQHSLKNCRVHTEVGRSWSSLDYVCPQGVFQMEKFVLLNTIMIVTIHNGLLSSFQLSVVKRNPNQFLTN